MKLLYTFFESIVNTFNWTIQSILMNVPWYQNYFYGLILISLIAWSLEILFPWRKNQSIIRKDFWLDGFYMFFNFFIFAIFISGFYAILEQLFSTIGISINSFALLSINELSPILQLLIFFILLDFVQWFTHVLLHRFEFLWNFHKVHHSVKEMGFAAHLRYHWMENIFYKPFKTLAVMLLGGFEPEQAYIVHFIAITIGHINHSNVKITWGPLKYVFNNPVMHLYHHAYTLPNKYGVNFGISLSLWDYLFKTNYIPKPNANEKLGFEGDESFPSDFISQNLYGFKKK
ncbi:MAG: sterol desaturase family protein [Flavobacteriales bacterium]|nr:sterol desaturase family protein [Flavobacteriales bacterium]